MPEKVRIQELPEERERSEALVDKLLSCQRPHAIAVFLKILYTSEEPVYQGIANEVHTAAQEMVVSTRAPLDGSGISDPASRDRGALKSRQPESGKCSFCNYSNSFVECHSLFENQIYFLGADSR